MTVLSPAQLEKYNSQGFLVCTEMLSVKTMDRVISEAKRLSGDEQLIKEANLRCQYEQNQRGDVLLNALDPVVDLSEEIKAIASDPVIRGALADLLGEPACLLRDRLIFKPPTTGGYCLRQDYIAWPDFPTTCTLVLIAADLSIQENGCIEVFPGGHKMGYLSPRDGCEHRVDAAQLGGLQGELIEMFPGDVLFFHCLLPHQSGPNLTQVQRPHLYFSYNALSDGGDQREHHYNRQMTRYFQDHPPSGPLKFFR